MNILQCMNYGKEKGCTEGAKKFGMMYVRDNCIES